MNDAFPALSTEEARDLTDRIKVAVEGTWLLVKDAYESRAWAALGYPSWDDYCTREFGASRLRLPREERQEVVASLRESGLSLRAISAVTGDSPDTVRRDLAGVRNRTPEPEVDYRELATQRGIAYVQEQRQREREPQRIVGTDGKRYAPPPPRPTTPPRPPVSDPADTAQQMIDAIRSLRHLLVARGGVEALAAGLADAGEPQVMAWSWGEAINETRSLLDELAEVLRPGLRSVK